MRSPLSAAMWRLLGLMVMGAVIAIGGNTLGHLIGVAIFLAAAAPFVWLAMRPAPSRGVPERWPRGRPVTNPLRDA
jgi:hypothetical protein